MNLSLELYTKENDELIKTFHNVDLATGHEILERYMDKNNISMDEFNKNYEYKFLDEDGNDFVKEMSRDDDDFFLEDFDYSN